VNCARGDYAFVIRPIGPFKAGTIVRVNGWAIGQWDVQKRDGTFFYAHDDDLCAMHGGEPIPDARCELFDAKPIWSDGEPFHKQFRQPPELSED
jgi:hypothetical protein